MEQSTDYGIPYAMHVYDIESIEECCTIQEVNAKLQQGYALLAIVTYTETDTFYHSGEPIYNSYPAYILGVPRAKYCTGRNSSHKHKATRKHWNHKDKKWFCPVIGCES